MLVRPCIGQGQDRPWALPPVSSRRSLNCPPESPLLRNRVSLRFIPSLDGESSEQSGESSEGRYGTSTSRMSYPEETSEETNNRTLIDF